MHGVGPDQARHARRRQGAQIAADIGGGQAGQTQRDHHHMGEILAHAMARGEGVGDRRVGIGNPRAIGEGMLDMQREVQRGGDDGRIGRKVRARPVADCRQHRRARSGIKIMGGRCRPHSAVHQRRLRHCADRRIGGLRRDVAALHAAAEPAFDAELPNRAFDHEAGNGDRPAAGTGFDQRRGRIDIQPIVGRPLAGPGRGLQAQVEAGEAHGRGVAQQRAMADLIDHASISALSVLRS